MIDVELIDGWLRLIDADHLTVLPNRTYPAFRLLLPAPSSNISSLPFQAYVFRLPVPVLPFPLVLTFRSSESLQMLDFQRL